MIAKICYIIINKYIFINHNIYRFVSIVILSVVLDICTNHEQDNNTVMFFLYNYLFEC